MRQGLGSECFGIDAYKAQNSAQTGNKLAAQNIAAGVKTLSQIARSGSSLAAGLKAAAGVALAGTPDTGRPAAHFMPSVMSLV